MKRGDKGRETNEGFDHIERDRLRRASLGRERRGPRRRRENRLHQQDGRPSMVRRRGRRRQGRSGEARGQDFDPGRAVQRGPHSDHARRDDRRRRAGRRHRRSRPRARPGRRRESGEGQCEADRSGRRHQGPQRFRGALHRDERRRDRRAGRAGRGPDLQGLKWDQQKDVYLGAIEDRKADTCMRRSNGAEAAFLAAVPGFDKSHIVRIPYDNTMTSAIDAVTTTLTANPAAQHWILYSCNDDGVLGAVRATENQGLKPDQVIGIGIDGSRSCSIFGTGAPSGFRGTMYIDSRKEGATAVQLLTASIEKKTPLPDITYVSADLINDANWNNFKDKLCKK